MVFPRQLNRRVFERVIECRNSNAHADGDGDALAMNQPLVSENTCANGRGLGL